MQADDHADTVAPASDTVHSRRAPVRYGRSVHRATRVVLTILAPAILAVGLSGCFGPASDPVVSTPPASASAAPSPTPTLAMPAGPVPGEVAFASVDSISVAPTIGSTTGPGLLDPTRGYTIEGECVGTSGTWELLDADPAGSGTQLDSGSIECGTPLRVAVDVSRDGPAIPVQLRFTQTDGLQLAWLRVVQE